MAAGDIRPAEGKIALQFLDDEEEEEEEEKEQPQRGSTPVMAEEPERAIPAVCVGVGPRVTVCKKGDTVLVRKYARNGGIAISAETRILDSWCVVATIANK